MIKKNINKIKLAKVQADVELQHVRSSKIDLKWNFITGDPDLVFADLHVTFLWRSAVPRLGLGSGLVHDSVCPPLGPHHRRLQTDESKGKPLEGLRLFKLLKTCELQIPNAGEKNLL